MTELLKESFVVLNELLKISGELVGVPEPHRKGNPQFDNWYKRYKECTARYLAIIKKLESGQEK